MACKDILVCPGSREFWADNGAFKKSVLLLLANVAEGTTVNVDDMVLDAGTNHIGSVDIDNFPASQTVDGTVSIASDTSLVSGRKTVTTAGVREAFALAPTTAKRIDIQALAGNTDKVVIGDNTVVAAVGARRGIALAAGQSYSFSITDLANIYIDSVVDFEGVSYNYFN